MIMTKMNGMFAQSLTGKPYSSVALDIWIETTMNKGSKLHWGETGLANAGVSLSKMDAPKVGKSVFCSFEVFHHNFRASHSLTVFI